MTAVSPQLLQRIRQDIQSMHAYAIQDSVGMVKLDAMENPYTLPHALQVELGHELANTVLEQVEIAIKYAGYIDKQVEEVGRAKAYENLPLPLDLDYSQVTALSFEVRQKLTRHRPETLGQAARISGVTPAAISLLMVHLKKKRIHGFQASPANATMDAA